MRSQVVEFALSGIQDAAQKFLDLSGDNKVFTFSGGLGAGKTTFIGALCKILGVKEVVSSPTFSIVQQYNTESGDNIYHIDLYRIKDEEEAINSGIEDCLLSGDICLVEWPEHALGIIPSSHIATQIEMVNPTIRKLLIQIPE